MQRLTKVEEEIMQIIWGLGECMVSEILEQCGDPKPPHSTISSVVRILEKKGFVQHKAYGRTYVYSPIVRREDYSKFTLGKMANAFFGGSMTRLVSFLVKENDLKLDEIAALLNDLDNSDNSKP